MTANNQLKTRRQVSLGAAGANGCLTTAVLMVAPSYSIVLWFTQPPRRSINNTLTMATRPGPSRFASRVCCRARATALVLSAKFERLAVSGNVR